MNIIKQGPLDARKYSSRIRKVTPLFLQVTFINGLVMTFFFFLLITITQLHFLFNNEYNCYFYRYLACKIHMYKKFNSKS